ncbi:MAG: helix-turn-helix domain-containing protein, partial [Synergistales bacterium]|nr:helix-turn-helix domain-containing protein [Synergistales bacterium]
MKDRTKALADLGKEVQRIREEKGLSIEDVTEITKIRSHFLEGIEEGNYEQFPSGVYIRGFVKSYLAFLEAEDMWPQFKPYLYSEEIVDTSELILGNFTPPARGFKHSSRLWIIVLLLILIAGLAWYGASIWGNRERAMLITENSSTIEEAAPSVEEKLSGPYEQDTPVGVNDDPGRIVASVSPDQNEKAALSGGLSPTGEVVGEPTVSKDLEAVPLTLENEGPFVSSPDKNENRVVSQDLPPAPAKLTLMMTRDCWVKLSTADNTLYQGIIKADTQRVFDIT